MSKTIEIEDGEIEKAVRKVLWAVEPLASGQERVLALKLAVERLHELKKHGMGPPV